MHNVTMSYKTKLIDSARFMTSSLSNLVDNLTKAIHKTKCIDFNCFLKYERVEDNLIKYKYLSCNKDYSNKLDQKFKKQFKNTFQFCNNNTKNFFFCY